KTVCIDQLSANQGLILEIQLSIKSGSSGGCQMWQVKNVVHKYAMRSLLLAGTTTLLASLALVPTVSAQIAISINPPVCSYGYYDYAPYGCAPMGFYGPGYFYNGIFLGVGPWASWGYSHGWGGHRFSGGGGGRYVAGRGNGGGRAYAANRGGGPSAASARGSNGSHGGASGRGSHATAARGGASHGGSHATAARGGASHGASGASHGGGSHGGGEHR